MVIIVGQRVKLRALEQGWDGDPRSPSCPEERGEVLGICGSTATVRVDLEYWYDSGDDGLRDVPLGQLEDER